MRRIKDSHFEPAHVSSGSSDEHDPQPRPPRSRSRSPLWPLTRRSYFERIRERDPPLPIRRYSGHSARVAFRNGSGSDEAATPRSPRLSDVRRTQVELVGMNLLAGRIPMPIGGALSPPP